MRFVGIMPLVSAAVEHRAAVALLLLALPAATLGAERFAVIAVGDPPGGPDGDVAELTYQLRAACRAAFDLCYPRPERLKIDAFICLGPGRGIIPSIEDSREVLVLQGSIYGFFEFPFHWLIPSNSSTHTI